MSWWNNFGAGSAAAQGIASSQQQVQQQQAQQTQISSSLIPSSPSLYNIGGTSGSIWMSTGSGSGWVNNSAIIYGELSNEAIDNLFKNEHFITHIKKILKKEEFNNTLSSLVKDENGN